MTRTFPDRVEQQAGVRACFSISRNEVAHSYALHWHDFYELELVVQGEGTNRINGVSHEMKPGSFFVLTPTDFHEICAAKPLTLYSVHFNLFWADQQVRAMLLAMPQAFSVHLQGAQRSSIQSELDTLAHEFSGHAPGRDAMLRSCFTKVAVQILRLAALPQQDPVCAKDLSYVVQALSVIGNSFKEPITLSDVASQVHLSPAYLSRCFHTLVGETFQAYLIRVRLSAAANLLAATDLPVTSVCLECGFRSPEHFCRSFKRRYGLTPAQLRRAARAPV